MVNIAIIIVFVVLLMMIQLTLITSAIWSSYNSILIINGHLGYHGTRKKDIPIIVRMIYPRTGDKIISLGCGDGRILKSLPSIHNASYVGIDTNRFLIFTNKIISKLNNQNINFLVQDIANTDLDKFNKIYIFSTQEYLEKFTSQIEQQCVNETIIISYMYPIKSNNLTLIEVADGEHKIYKYKKTT